MSIANTHLAIRNHFYGEWAGTTPAQYEEESFDNPDDSWVRLSVRDKEQERSELGRDAYDTPGIIFLQLFTKIGKPIIEREQLIDQLCAVFRGKQFNGITTYGPTPINLGVINGWQQDNISFEFETNNIY